MRLIDADAEIAKIEQEIKRTKAHIKEWENNRADRGGYYNVDTKIEQLKNNIAQARAEIECLKNYSTAYDVDKVVEQLRDRSTLSRPVGWSKSYEIITLDDAIEIVKGGRTDEDKKEN